MCDQARLNKILTAVALYAQNVFKEQLDSVVLYGSYARGDYDAESDIDLMILVDMDREALMSYRRQFSALTSQLSLEDEDCVTISLLLESSRHLQRFCRTVPFYQNVMREGVRVSA